MKLNFIKLKSKTQMVLPLVIYLTLMICIICIKDLISTKLAPSKIPQNFMYYLQKRFDINNWCQVKFHVIRITNYINNINFNDISIKDLISRTIAKLNSHLFMSYQIKQWILI